MSFNSEARELFMQLSRARTTQDKIKVAMKLRPKHFAPLAPQSGESRTGLSMGEHQALTTHAWGISREAQDEIAMRSHNNMRSEEHTSELQSRGHLVCRLLLDKKNSN